jgi:replication factor C subunit 3/5
MFLVDKYFSDSNQQTWHQSIIQKILDSFDNHAQIYNDIDNVMKKSPEEFENLITDLERGIWRYANFQHLVVYGPTGSGKEYLINKLLEKIYGKQNTQLSNVEYTINGYGSSKTKVFIKQSKFHIVIEPNSNGFDKYLIQEIIQNYAKTELLNILKYKRLFKIVVINKIDNLSYSAQASLRTTMEKYASTCKFIFLCDQLSKMIEPLRSRCVEIRVPLPSNIQILNTILHISKNEQISLNSDEIKDIIYNCDNKISNAIWLLEFKKRNYIFDNSWERKIDEIVNIIINPNNYKQTKILKSINKIRECFYSLSITNINTQKIFKLIMNKILNYYDDINLKSHIIEITSLFELRHSQGTRHINHVEGYICRIFYLLTNYKKGQEYHYNLDHLEI